MLTEFKVNIIQLFNIGAMFNGLIFCYLLLVKKENWRANQFLALLLFCLSYSVFTSFLLEFKLFDSFPFLYWLPLTMTFWIGPAFYFYIRNLINPDFKFNHSHLWHFAFIILNYLHSIYHLVYGKTIYHPLFHNFTEAVVSYGLIPIIIYTIVSFRNVISYQKSLLNEVSTTKDLDLRWIKQLTWLFAIVFILIVLLKLIDYEELIDFSQETYQGQLFPYRDLLLLLLTTTIYFLAIRGYKQKQTVKTSETYSKELDHKDYSSIIDKLIKSMEEGQLFLQPELDLKMLSEATHLSRRDISIALNQYLNNNFYYFVNKYRVDEVKKRLRDPQFQNLKILSIAHECGFNSKPTFNRVFKEMTGKSPKEYQAGHK